MLTTDIIINLAVLGALLLLKYSCADQDKTVLKANNLFKTDKEYYEDRPSKRESKTFISVAIIGMVVVFVVLALSSCSQEEIQTDTTTPHVYYISQLGNDANDGLSPATAWQTTTNINTVLSYDNVVFNFRATDTFGNTNFQNANKGVEIKSYGQGRATLSIMDIHNSSNFYIHDINFFSNGINILNSQQGNTKISNITIENVYIYQANIGIFINSLYDTSGVTDVHISNVDINNAREGGIYSKGYFASDKTGYSHSNIHIYNTTVRNIFGSIDATTHTGNGIMLSDVEFSSIINSTAYNNGILNTNCGGPVGIWYWDSKDVLIQGCEAYNNNSQGCDGGGFDFDGGVVNGIMQYNYSHDNNGAGFMVGQFAGSRPMDNITVRYNVSNNDANGDGGSVYLFNYAGAISMTNINIYNNTIIQDNKPSFRSLQNLTNNNVNVINNIFTANVQTTNYVNFLQNHIGTVNFENGYSLPPSSPLIDAGINLSWDIGPLDFYGNAPFFGTAQDFGAVEFNDTLLGI